MKRIWLGGVVVVGLVAAYFFGRAHAAGVPSTQPLFYAGTLTDMSGAPASGSHGFIVKLYTDATTTSAACTFASAATVTSGRFRLQLDDTCTAAVHANPDLWLELTVDTQPFPRAKLGAVPYALEAANASAVPLSGISGVTPTTAWPGAVSPERVAAGTTNGFVRTRDTSGTQLLAANVNVTTITGQTGTWVNSITHSGTGNFDVNFVSGVFTTGPICVVTAESGTAGADVSASATASSVHVVVADSSGTPIDQPFTILCVGR